MFEQNITLGPGTGSFTQHTLEIVIMLLGFSLLGLWLGWALWGRYKQQLEKLNIENQSLNLTAENYRNELIALKTRFAGAENDNNSLSSQVESLGQENERMREEILSLEKDLQNALATNRQLDTELGLSHTPDTVEIDIPLEIVPPTPAEPVLPETANPVAEKPATPFVFEPVALPDDHMLRDFIEPEEDLHPALDIPPVVAAEQEMDLHPVQDVPLDLAPETEAPDANIVFAAADAADDLTVVEGIGPKIQLLLNQFGIRTYRQLAETEVERLKEILSNAGPQLAMHDPGTWPSQANLAANDQWDTLKSVQGFLKGGKKPG